MGRGSKRFLYVVGVLVLAAATLELGTRLLGGPESENSAFPRDEPMVG